jgi:DNA polymerase III subunit alpha
VIGLHVHGEHSFLDGLSSTDQIADRAKELGQGAVALTDHGECSGHLSFEKSCLSRDIKPIFGMEGYLSHDIKKQKAEKDRLNSHIVLLAENNVGLSNLWAISSIAYREENFYYKPLADWAIFEQYHQGLIATSACMLSFMSRAILADQKDVCRSLVGRYLETFGEDNFFLELHTWQIIDPKSDEHRKLNSDMSKINQGLVQLSQELSVPCVVVNDAHYSWPEQAENHQLVWSMSTNQDQLENKTAAAHIMGDDEVIEWMSRHGVSRSVTEEAIRNTEWIGERCNAQIERKLHLPRVTSSAREDRELFLAHVERGFKAKVVDAGLDVEKYAARTLKETDSIIGKGFDGYLNVVADYCKFAKTRTPDKEAWLVGPARGSAGGSLVCFLMDITEVDPVKYDLLFERFISPGRKGYPDIDLDFPQSKRELLKEYFAQKYGQDNVAGIGTLSRLHAKSCLRDVAKSQGVPYAEVNIMSKIIDKVPTGSDGHIPSWDEIMAAVGSELAPWIAKYEYVFRKVRELNGLVRQSGTHAAGMIISDESLIGLLPLRRKGGNIVTQFEYQECEELGFIKFDILGVRHLDTLTEAWKLRQVSLLGKSEEDAAAEFDPRFYYDMNDSHYRRESTWERVGKGETLGIFQIETDLGSSTAKGVKPKSEYDMSALISITRPGVIGAGLLDEYIARRHGLKKVTYQHPLLEKITANTFGIIVYQEQAMQIAVECAGYSLEDADRIRKMIGKKLVDDMKAERPAFIERCAAHPPFRNACKGDPRMIAGDIWVSIEASGSYSFNMAHGIGYGLVSTWGAWNVDENPAEYLVACLRTDPDKRPRYLKELRRMGWNILPPDINESSVGFSLTPSGVRFGLLDVHKVGTVAVNEIMAHRPFDSLEDVFERTSKRCCNALVLENLIKIGAFDKLGPREAHLRKLFERVGGDKLGAETPNFDDPRVIWEIEKELVGLYITASPMDQYSELINSRCLPTPEHMSALTVGELAEVGGQVSLIKEHVDKRGNKMCFLELTFEDQVFPITAFSDKYKAAKPFLAMDAPVICQVTKGKRGVLLRDVVRLDW